MNKHLEFAVMKEALDEISNRKIFISKLDKKHFMHDDAQKLFRFLKMRWDKDINDTMESMMPELIKYGLLDTFLDVTNIPTGHNFEKNVNYLKKSYFDIQNKLAVDSKDYEKAYLFDQEKKKIFVDGSAYYSEEQISEQLQDASDNGLNFTTFQILKNQKLSETFRIVKNQTTVLTGVPRSGKTNLADAISVYMGYKYNWRTVMFSPEAQPVRLHLASIYSKFTGEPLLKSGKQVDSRWFNDHIKIINTNLIRRELDVVLSLIEEEQPDLFIIDPWNTIIRTMDNNKQFISESLDLIKELTYKIQAHAIVIAHPTKLKKAETGKYSGWYPPATAYDIDGAAEWWSKPDNVLSLWRPRDNNGEVELHIQKIKWEHVLGEVDMVPLKYKHETGEYL